ncbi:MAG: exodeoxyribonuclease V subunit gamma, partial [Thioalkalivibrio sp.]|nr:exodeoxyribonuclease V subunit gamma [Thioalkalivibrio sp.]
RTARPLPMVHVDAAGWRLEAQPDAVRIPGEDAPQGTALQLEHTVSRLRDRQGWRIDKLVGAWIRHLVVCTARADVETRLLGLDTECRFRALDPATARAHLETLLAGWAAALERPLPLAAAVAGAWLRAEDQDQDPHAAALRVLQGDGYHEAGELARRPALARAWPDPEALLADPAMAHWSARLYRPLLDTLSSAEDSA